MKEECISFFTQIVAYFIGKASNIRQRLNAHTASRTIREIAYKKRRNPKHIIFVSWILASDAGARDIIETAYLRTYGTAWNLDKIDETLDYPEAPEDEDFHNPEVQEYIQKHEKIINDSI
jgi:hypothetical protein